MAEPRLACPAPAPPPVRPELSGQPSRFILLEREVEQEFRPRMLQSLQLKVDTLAEQVQATAPVCPQCARRMSYHDTRPVSWLACWGRVQAWPVRYRCPCCKQERRPLLDLLGVEPGRICGSLARLLALLGTVAPYELAARLAELLLGFKTNAMGVWRATQRLGQAAASYGDALSQYHADSRSEGACIVNAPPTVVLGVDGCVVGMQVHKKRRRRTGNQMLAALPAVTEGQPVAARKRVPGGQDRCSVTAGRAGGKLARPPVMGAAVPGYLLGECGRDLPAIICSAP